MLILTAFRAHRHLRRLQQFQRRLRSTDSTADQFPLKFHDLQVRRFGLVLALSSSECREAMLAASGSFEGTRRSTMDRQLPTTTNELRVTVVRTRDSAGDEELVAAAKGGDELAFEKIVKRHRQRIFALALRYARSREDAEDIVQQTFQRAFIHLRGFEGRSSFSTWLTSIGINQSLMLLRRRRVLREVPIDDPSDDEGTTPALEMADTSPDPASSYLEQEEARVLVEAIGQLRPAIRKAVELTGLRELSMVEAARQLGISVVAMKSRMFHARRKLGEALKRNMRSRRVSGDGISAVAKDARRIPQNHLDCAWN